MPKPAMFAEVRRRLLRNGFGRAYADRVARELEEHWVDLVGEGLRQGLARSEAEAEASANLGSAAGLVEEFSARLRQSSWLGRHPTLGFGLLAISTTLLWWAVFLPTAGVATGLWGWDPKKAGGVPPPLDLMLTCIDWIRSTSYVAIPALICHIAHRFHCGWKPALWGCLMVAIHNAAHLFVISGTTGNRIATWGYSFSSGGPELLPILAPLAVFAISTAWNARPKPEPPDEETSDVQYC